MPRRRLPTLILAVALACAAPNEARASHPAAGSAVTDAGLLRVRQGGNRQSLFFVFPRRSSTQLGHQPVKGVFKLLEGGFLRRETGCPRQLRNGWTISLSGPLRQSAGVYTMQVSGIRECLFLPAQASENFVDWQLRLEFHQVVHEGEPALALRVTVTSVRGAHYTDYSTQRPPPARFHEAEAARVAEGLSEMTSWMARTLKAETDLLPQFFADNYGTTT